MADVSRVQVPSSDHLYSIFGFSTSFNLFFLDNRDTAVRSARDRWKGRVIVCIPAKRDSDKALVFDKQVGAAFVGSHLQLEDCGSVFVSQTYAEHHGLRGMLLPFWCLYLEQMHIIRELRGDTVLGWTVIRTGRREAFDKYLAGYAECDDGGPDTLEVVSFNDREQMFLKHLDAVREVIPHQTYSHVTLQAPPFVPTRIPAAWLVELRFI